MRLPLCFGIGPVRRQIGTGLMGQR